MTAVASSQLGVGTIQQTSNHEIISDYVKPQLRQPLPHPSTHAANNNTPVHQGVLAQENGRRKRPSDRSADPRHLAVSRSNSGRLGQPAQTPAESSLGQDPHGIRPKGQLLRANTDIGPRRESHASRPNVTEENWELRHGWEDQYNSSEYLGLLSSVSRWSACAIEGRRARTEADHVGGRPSTCITPKSATIRAASRRMKIIIIRRKNGE